MTVIVCRTRPLDAGFSLFELLVVLAVMTILGGLGFSGLGGLQLWIARQEAQALFHELEMACLRYRMENGAWPDSLTAGEISLNGASTDWRDELAPYMEQDLSELRLTDGFGNTDLRLVVDVDGDHWIRASEAGGLNGEDLWARAAVYSLDEQGILVMASWLKKGGR